MKVYKEDKGENFGKWGDLISRFLYQESTIEILSKIKIPASPVGDFGGANGNLKTFISNSVSIDIDPTKKPDINENILTHNKFYKLVVIRYVLHYLNDYEVLRLFKNINAKHILVIQFVNTDLKGKYNNSKNEFKYFRTPSQLESLIPSKFKEIYSKDYSLGKEYYKNRLGEGNYSNHIETLKAYYL